MWDGGLTFALDYQAFLVSTPALRRKLPSLPIWESKHSVSAGLSCFTATPWIVHFSLMQQWVLRWHIQMCSFDAFCLYTTNTGYFHMNFYRGKGEGGKITWDIIRAQPKNLIARLTTHQLSCPHLKRWCRKRLNGVVQTYIQSLPADSSVVTLQNFSCLAVQLLCLHLRCMTVCKETVISEAIATVRHFGEGFGARCFSCVAVNWMKRAISSFL